MVRARDLGSSENQVSDSGDANDKDMLSVRNTCATDNKRQFGGFTALYFSKFYLFIYSFIFLLIYLVFYLFIYFLFIYLFIYLFVYLFFITFTWL